MVLKMWVERGTNESINVDCGGFKSVWTRFHVYVNSNNILISMVIHHQGGQENT